MNPAPENPMAYGAAAAPAPIDDTLRLMARAPAPEGLEERVRAALRAAPRGARVLAWPAAAWTEGGWAAGWIRAAAAAAIVVVVAGGGWGVYTRVQHQPDRMTAPTASHQPAAAGGFSSAGAMRTPQTVKGPVLVNPENTRPEKSKPEKAQARRAKPGKKSAVGRVTAKPADATAVRPAAAVSR